LIIKEIIVVEGRDDTVAIQRAVKADTIETGGSALTKAKLQRIKKAQEIRGVIVFTDPDFPGEKIRKTISNYVPGVKHAFITREEAIGPHDLGVENASPEVIRKALNEAKTEWISEPAILIPWERLIVAGLAGGEKAKERRIRLGQILGIGYSNAKQLYKRLLMFQISLDEFEQALIKIEKDEQ